MIDDESPSEVLDVTVIRSGPSVEENVTSVPRDTTYSRPETVPAQPAASVEVDSGLNSDEWIDVPYTVSVITASTLEERQVRNTTEALKRIPGVLIQKTANGQGSPYIRGFTGYRTLAVIDGVRYNNSIYRDGPSEYFSLIDHFAIDTIQLIQGPGSVSYGSDAIGGTLSIETKSADYLSVPDNQHFSGGETRYRWSSAEQSHQSRIEMQTGVGGKWGFHLGGSAKHFGDVKAAGIGTQPWTGYDEWAYDARFDYSLSDNWTFTAAHQLLSQDDVWRTHSTIYGVSFAGSEIGSDRLRLKDQQRSLSYVKLSGEELDGFVDEASLTLSYQNWQEDGNRIREAGNSLAESFDSDMWGIDFQLGSDSPVGYLTYGVDYYRDKVDSDRVDLNPDGSVDRVRIQGPIGDDSSFDQFGLFLQNDIDLTERLGLSIGGRFSQVKADVGRYEDPATGAAASFSDSWSTTVGSARMSYDLTGNDEYSIFAGISESFRAPNLADLSRSGGSRSDEIESAAVQLEPEQFLTYEIGMKVRTKNLISNFSIYRTNISDFITSTPTGRTIDGLREVTKQNSAGGFVQGIEAGMEYRFEGGFSVFGNISWVEGESDVFLVSGSSVASREPLSRIQPVIGSGGIRWTSPSDKHWIELSVIAAGDADRLNTNDLSDTQRIPPGGTPGYAVYQLNSGWELDEATTFYFGIENLFDEAYRSHGSGSNEPGRGVVLGVNRKF
ncbi:MAG: TonB-dependent receptor [Verrucomicrobiales bacterium]|nr:TonB-dependent receptor [Verrucomicrobiales bacterium]